MIVLSLPGNSYAELGRDLRWRSPDAVWADVLNAGYSPLTSREGTSPADGIIGSRQAQAAAKAFGGHVIWPTQEPVEPNIIY